MHTGKRDVKRIFRITLLVLLLALASAVQAQAAGVISGRYQTKSDKNLTLEIKIGSPAPVTLIIIQYLPPGVEPAAAEPPYKKYNAQKGEVRWLLRNVQSGTLQVKLGLKTPVPPDKLSAEIRCMDPATGKLVTTRVR